MHAIIKNATAPDQRTHAELQVAVERLQDDLRQRDAEIARLQAALDAAGERMRHGAALLQESAVLARAIDEIALEVFQQSLPANAWVRFGEIYFGLNAFEDAQRFFECALAADPANVDALNNLGVLQFAQGDYSGAEASLLSALSHNPKRRDVRENLRLLYATHPVAAFTPA